MTSELTAILVDDGGRPTYGVAVTVLEATRATPDQSARVRETLGDTQAFSATSEAPIHLLAAEELEPFRLSDEQRQALETRGGEATSDDDVTGYAALPGSLVILTPHASLPPTGAAPTVTPLLTNTSFRVNTLTFSSNATGIG